MDEVLNTVHKLQQAEEDSSDDDLPVGHLNEPREKPTTAEICQHITSLRNNVGAAEFKQKSLRDIRVHLQKQLGQSMAPYKKQIKKYVKDEVAKIQF